VLEEIDKGTLSKEEYPYVKDPAGSSYHSSSSQPGARPPVNPTSKPVQSRRTVGKAGGSTWASKGRASSEDGYSRFALPLKFVLHFLVSFGRSMS
jgi:syntaxin-binding protein 1